MITKLKYIPTNAQARILKALAIHNGLRIIWNPSSSSGAEWAGTNWPAVKRETGRLLGSTVRKLSANGWIEPDEEGSIFWLISEHGHQALTEYGAIEIVVADVAADELLKAIKQRHRHPNRKPATIVTELYLHDYAQRRIDAFAISARGDTWAYEIKVSRSDWLRELGEPEKSRPAQDIAQRFYFVAPRGVIEPAELPLTCGLFDYENGQLHTIVHAPFEHRNQPTWELVGTIAKRLSE